MDTQPKESTHNRKEKRLAPGSILIEKKDSKKDSKSKLTPNSSGFFSFLENKLIMNLMSHLIVFSATILYLITLTGCPHDSQAECLKNFNQEKIKYFVMVLVASAFLYTLIFNFFIYKKIDYWIPLYTSVILWYVCFIYDTGTDLKTHGAINRVFLFTLVLISFIFQHFVVHCINIFDNQKGRNDKGYICISHNVRPFLRYTPL
jgi:hypothetical protein